MSICVNVQSLLSNIAQIKLTVDEFRPIIFCCTESRVTEDINLAEFSIDGYSAAISCSKNRHSGGVVVYIQCNIRYKILENKVFDHNNIIVIDILDDACRGLWIVVYHSPNYPHALFINELELVIERFSHLHRNMTITGDFNINIHSNNLCTTYKQRLMSVARMFSLKQLVKKFTRVTQNSKTIIDHFYTSDTNFSLKVSGDDCIADHKSLLIYKVTQRKQYDYKEVIDRRLCTEDNIVAAIVERKSVLNQTLPFEERAYAIKNIIENSVNSLIRQKFVSTSYAKIWYTPELHQLRRERDIAHSTAQLINDTESWRKYRYIKNKYNKQLDKAHNDDIKKVIIDCKDDQKKLWRALKSQMNNTEPLPNVITIRDQILSDEINIANHLNEFFVNSINEINQSIVHEPFRLTPLERNIQPLTTFVEATSDQILRILTNIKSKSGINNVNKDVVKSSMKAIGNEITDLINESLNTGIFPEAFKTTVVTPIQKVKGTCKAEELRPINNPGVLDKVLQTIVKNQLEQHIKHNHLLSDLQSAYREKHSCETALNLVIAKWKHHRYMGRKIVAVFLDLSRAFETIDREILLKVLRKNGIDGTVWVWFKSFLMNRKQRTKFKNKFSADIGIEIGVPQGTPLSSLLFIIYLNDIVKILKYCHINLFADDMLIWIAEENVLEAIRKLNEDLKRVFSFLNMMKLKLNITKTKWMVVGAETNEKVKINEQEIEKVKEMKYLGLIVDNELSFKPNNEYLIKKVSKKVSFLRRLKKRLDVESRLTLYHSIIAPHFDFCSTILFLLPDYQIEKLQKLQNRAMRIILNVGHREHISDMLKNCDLLSVKQRIYFNVLFFMFKITRGLLPEYMSVMFKRLRDVQPYLLRNNGHLRPPNYVRSDAQCSLEYKGVIEFNKMLEYGVSTFNEVERFKQSLKAYVQVKIN